MKTFKQYLNEEVPSIPSPIHFKHVSGDGSSRLNEDLNDWVKKSDNEHLIEPGGDARENDVISEKITTHHKLDDQHKRSIEYYTSVKGSKNINNDLIDVHNSKKTKENKKPFPDFETHSDKIDDAIKKAPIKHDVHVYSGVSFDPTKHLNKKGKMHSPAYISATHSKNMARSYAHDHKQFDPKLDKHISHIIHIPLKKGDPAIHVEKISNFPGEYETIIKRGSTLKHHGYEDHTHPAFPDKVYRVHKMSIVKK